MDAGETGEPSDNAGSRSVGRPRCPLCGHDEYRREAGKLDSEWGVTAHRVDMLVCLNCGNVLLFYQGNTIFDFD